MFGLAAAAVAKGVAMSMLCFIGYSSDDEAAAVNLDTGLVWRIVIDRVVQSRKQISFIGRHYCTNLQDSPTPKY